MKLLPTLVAFLIGMSPLLPLEGQTHAPPASVDVFMEILGDMRLDEDGGIPSTPMDCAITVVVGLPDAADYEAFHIKLYAISENSEKLVVDKTNPFSPTTDVESVRFPLGEYSGLEDFRVECEAVYADGSSVAVSYSPPNDQ